MYFMTCQGYVSCDSRSVLLTQASYQHQLSTPMMPEVERERKTAKRRAMAMTSQAHKQVMRRRGQAGEATRSWRGNAVCTLHVAMDASLLKKQNTLVTFVLQLAEWRLASRWGGRESALTAGIVFTASAADSWFHSERPVWAHDGEFVELWQLSYNVSLFVSLSSVIIQCRHKCHYPVSLVVSLSNVAIRVIIQCRHSVIIQCRY